MANEFPHSTCLNRNQPFLCITVTERLKSIKPFLTRYSPNVQSSPSKTNKQPYIPSMDVNEITRAEQTQVQWAWFETLTSGDGLKAIYTLASSFNNGRPCVGGYYDSGGCVRMGGYNMSFLVEFDDGTKWVVRFPMIGAIARELVDEKLKTEVATMMFLSEKTTIPIPELIGYGLTGNPHHPKGLPFLIMTYIHGKTLRKIWKDLDDAAKDKIYEQLADISIQLRSQSFDRVGALTLDNRNRWSLSNRPLTRPLASLQRDGIAVRMDSYYKSASEYFAAYFGHHRRRFIEQPNSTDELSDAREKYAGLSLFEELIPRYVVREYDEGPFVLCHGDFHQPNLLLNDDFRVVAVLDWEWSCVLPIQVACLPPVCLSPLKMEELALGEGRDDFLDAAEKFLHHLGEKECSTFGERTISIMLKEMMSNGGYWFGQAIQDIYNFEYLFWDNLFPAVHRMSERDAIDLVFNSPEHRSAEETIQRKLRQNDEYKEKLRVFRVIAFGTTLKLTHLAETPIARYLREDAQKRRGRESLL